MKKLVLPIPAGSRVPVLVGEVVDTLNVVEEVVKKVRHGAEDITVFSMRTLEPVEIDAATATIAAHDPSVILPSEARRTRLVAARATIGTAGLPQIREVLADLMDIHLEAN